MDGEYESSPQEIELKLLFPPAARSLVDAHPALQSAAPQVRHQVTTYFDTPDLRLAQAGLTLRVRLCDGARVQTVKSTSDGTGLAARRGEWEWPIEGDRPELARLFEVAGSLLDAGLAGHVAPVFVTDVQRTVRTLRLDDGAVVEVAIDEGRIEAGAKREPISEIELEAKAGPLGPLYALALALQKDVPLRLGAEPKAARGFRLRSGQAPAPVHPLPSALDRQVGAAAGFRAIVGAALAGLLANQPATLAGDAEGVHQMRVAVRRLRSALVLFAPRLSPAAVAPFEAELRRLGQVLGEARDWDVFCLETLPAAFGDAPCPELRRPAEAARVAAHARLGEELAGPALTGLALRLSVWIEEPGAGADGPDMVLADVAPDLLDRLLRKVFRRGRHIGRRSDAELHALRKALKKLRYGVDGLGALYPRKAVKATLKPCKTLQELLGQYNDAATAAMLARRLEDSGGDAAHALVAWSEKRRQRALRRLDRAWHAFRDAAPFWH